jgi:hypothetical protein
MAVFVLGFFGVAFLITSFPDNSTRDLIPIAIALAGLSTWALQHFHLHEYGFGWLFPVIIKLLTILQFIMFFYRARIYIPSDKDIAAGQLLLQKISHSRGEILLPYHNHYARLSGKIPFADWNKLLESGSSEKKVQTQKLPPEILSALEEKRFSIIILDEPLNFLPRAIKENYVLVEELFDDPTVFRTKCGVPTRPQYLYRAK